MTAKSIDIYIANSRTQHLKWACFCLYVSVLVNEIRFYYYSPANKLPDTWVDIFNCTAALCACFRI